MTKQTSTTQDWQERFDQLAGKGTTFDDWLNHDGCSPGMMKHFIATELAKAKADERREILELLKKVEAELEKWFDMPDTTENWKTWKKIRNTINREDV